MSFAWHRLALADLRPYQWRTTSYTYRIVGCLANWRQSSLLLKWSEPLGALLISLVLVVAPFSSTSLIGVLLLALSAYWFLLTVSDPPQQRGVTPIHLLVLLYWCIATIATAFSSVKSAAFSGWIELTLYLVMFAITARILRSPRLCSSVITVFLLVALVVSVYGIRQEFFGVEQLATWNDPNSPLAKDTRVYSYLGNPNLLAGYLLPAIALSIAAVFAWQGLLRKALALTMVVINSACLYFTDSRGGWLAMLGLLLSFFLLLRYWWNENLPRFWRTWLLPIVFGTGAVLLLVAIFSLEPLRLRVMSIFAGRNDSSNNFRMNVWDAVFQMIEDRPLLGIGPGHDAFNKVYPRYMKTGYTALSAYSIFLETAVETGIIGLTCLLWLILVTFNEGIRQIGRLRAFKNPQGFWLMAAIAAMVGLLVQGFADTVWYRPQIQTLWWLMMAIIASHYNYLSQFKIKLNNAELRTMNDELNN